ncbi:MAG: fused MFS/spermidine synthase [Polaromonas sp.]
MPPVPLPTPLPAVPVLNKNAGDMRWYLILTAALCGALVMVIEVLGSRVIGPVFGVSLFVWTALITVTLVALAAGYAAGGWLADRRSSPDYLYAIILVAGLLTAATPLVKATVLQACLPLGLRLGSLASAFLLFGPALFLLGCVSPYLVRIAARELKNIGRTVGNLYAISTAGSFAGTVATGFFLIAYLGVNRIFVLAGLLLMALGAGYFVLFRRQWAVLALLVLPFLLAPPDRATAKVLADGTRVQLTAQLDSFYGDLRVVDYAGAQLRTRELLIDGLVQGGIDLASNQSVYEYAYLMQFLPYVLNPGGKNCLVVGLGTGIVPSWYAARGIHTEVVDIDPKVASLAQQHFGFDRNIPVHVEDARYFLNRSTQRYDYVVLDVFNGDTTPGHVLSLEAMRLLKARMTPDGVLAINLVGTLGERGFMTASVIKTVQAVFGQVQTHPVFASTTPDAYGNLVIIAYDGPARPLPTAQLAAFPVHPMAADGVRRGLQNTYRFPAGTPAMLLTDDYNPIDFYDLWVKEKVRRTILETTDWDILLG